MTTFVYADNVTKQIARISKTQHPISGDQAEVQLADGHPIESDSDPSNNWKLNDAGDGVEKFAVSIPIAKVNYEKRIELLFGVASYVVQKLTAELSGTHTPEQVLGLLQSFISQHTLARMEFVLTGNPQFLTDLAQADLVHDFWLNAEISSGLTYRNYLINTLTQWQSILLP